jgi:hypothetical protein
MPDRDREKKKKTPHQRSGSQEQSAHVPHPPDREGHFTGGPSEDSRTKSGRGTRSDETDSEGENEG